jgi:hypothetical protein
MDKMNGEGRGVKKIRGRKVTHSQSTEMVISAYSFMKKETNTGRVINVNQI